MSYDLMVFNPKTAPRTASDFMQWYKQQTAWEEDHSYTDPKVTSEALNGWFLDMITDFPALNGPYAPADDDDKMDNDEITDYSIGKEIIYAGFRWSVAEKAYPKMLTLAEKHKVGFYDPSGDGSILFPKNHGRLEAINIKSKPWWKFWS